MIIIPDTDAANARRRGWHDGACFALAEAIYDRAHTLGLRIHPRTIRAEARHLLASREEVRVCSGGYIMCQAPGTGGEVT